MDNNNKEDVLLDKMDSDKGGGLSGQPENVSVRNDAVQGQNLDMEQNVTDTAANDINVAQGQSFDTKQNTVMQQNPDMGQDPDMQQYPRLGQGREANVPPGYGYGEQWQNPGMPSDYGYRGQGQNPGMPSDYGYGGQGQNPGMPFNNGYGEQWQNPGMPPNDGDREQGQNPDGNPGYVYGKPGYPYGPGFYQYPEQGGYEQEMEVPITMGEWLVSMLLMLVPCVNIVLLMVWAFSDKEKKSKSNYFKARLIFYGILVGIFFLWSIFYGIISLIL